MKPLLLVVSIWIYFAYSLHSQNYIEYQYKITWFQIPIGYARIGKYGIINYQGEPCYILKTSAYNTPFLQKIYPVKDQVISYWSVRKKIPYYSEKRINEGKYHKYQKAFFNYRTGIIHWEVKERSKRTQFRWKFRKGKTQIVPNLQDILSAIFYNQESSKQPYPNAKFSIPLFDDTKRTQLQMWIQKKETISVTINQKTRQKEAWIVKPYYRTSGLFRLAGNLILWISADSQREILKMKAKIPYVGHIYVDLVAIHSR